jgi:hypothetical protein
MDDATKCGDGDVSRPRRYQLANRTTSSQEPDCKLSNDDGDISCVLRINIRKVTNLVLQPELLRILLKV